jgi:hypothetical protein|tara:strand:+ start:275 stop:502 length:228 start_codon:yes stop_codon:yes gene_type:complete
MSKLEARMSDLQFEIDKLQINYEAANILLTMVVETYTDHDTGKINGAYVYRRDLLDDKINKYFKDLGFKLNPREE